MRKVNLKFLLGMMLIVAAASGAVAGVHYFQHQRIAAALWFQATRAEEEGQAKDAARYLKHYLEFQPRDLEAKAWLGRLYVGDAFAATPRARSRGLNLLDDVLTRDPDRTDLRLLAVQTALPLQRLKVARDHLDVLWKAATAPDSKSTSRERGELAAYWGQLLEAENRPAEAIDWCRQAVRDNPEEADSYVRLAYLLRRQRESDPEKLKAAAVEADRMIDQLVERNPVSARAYLARWRYRRDFDTLRVEGNLNDDRLEEAAEDVVAALKREPESPESLLAAADLERLRAQSAAADQNCERGERERRVQAHREAATRYLQRGLLIADKPDSNVDDAMRFQLLWHLASLGLDDPRPVDSPEGKESRAAAEKAIARIRKLKSAPAAADFLEGRLRLRTRRWAEAAALFEQARPLFAQSPDLAAQADFFLGQCYEQLDEPNQMYSAYSRAITWNPGSVQARLGMAAAQWAMGRLDEAAQQYRAALERGAPARAWLDFARVEMRRQLQRDDRDWKAMEEALDGADRAMPDAIEPPLLRAEMLVARGDLHEAEALLRKTRTAHAKSAVIWTALAHIAARRKDNDQALQFLGEAERELGDQVDIRLARAHFLAMEGRSAVGKIVELRTNVEKFPPEQQDRLLGGLVEACLRTGDLPAARKLLREMTQGATRQNDLRLRMLLFDLALRDGSEGDLEQAIQDLRGAESREGPLSHYAQAMRQIVRARKGEGDRTAGLTEARMHLDQAAKLRPSWAPVALARADVDELLGNPEQVIQHLKQAIDQGETNPRVIQRLVMTLFRRQRYAEADQELKRLRQSLLVNSELGRLAAGVALHRGEMTRALELARDAIRDDSLSFRDQLWHGQLLAAASSPSEAETKLRKAVELAPAEPEPWVALIHFLVSQKRQPEAKQTLLKAGERLSPEKAVLALAECHELLGDANSAARQYASALEQRSDDVAVLRAVAAYYLRSGRIREATPLLEQIVEGKVRATPADLDWARRGLAIVLSAGTDYQRFRRALELVGLRLDEHGQLAREKDRDDASTDLLRARARVLATHGQRQFRERAIETLELLARRQALLPDDRFVLALLYDAQGTTSKSHDLLRDLALAHGQTPPYLVHFVQVLIRKKDFDSAGAWIERIEALEKQREAGPNGFSSVELRARVLEGLGEGDRALELLRQHVRRSGARPEEILLVVASLSRQQRFADALALCEEHWDRCPPEAVGGACVALLRSMEPTDEQCRRIEGRLQAAVDARLQVGKQPNPVLYMHLADLSDQRGRYAESEEHYRRLLRIEPNNIVALNNLAWLIVQRTGDGSEALPMITTAVNGIGRRPDLLDTRALVYLALGKHDQALADLKEATGDTPTPTRLFHLALALQKGRDRDAALKALRQARDLGLTPEKLHPIEQQACRKLFEELQSN